MSEANNSNNTVLQHPVPQNIIQVEFKLFGSFTLKQFGKMLIGCLIAVALFPMPLPIYIKFPLMGISVFLGFGTAIVPQLSTWVGNYVKSVFISPRYVWMKRSRPPEMLTASPRANLEQTQKVESSKTDTKVDLSEISLDKLLSSVGSTKKGGTRVNSDDEDFVELAGVNNVGSARSSNIERIFGDTFADSMVADKNKNTKNPKQQPVLPQSQKTLVTMEDYITEINLLKKQLNELNKKKQEPEKEKAVMDRINVLYQQLQFMQKTQTTNENKRVTQSNLYVETAQGQRIGEGQIVFGIVVDKDNRPIPDTKIVFREIQTGKFTSGVSSSDGRFTTTDKLFNGDYEVLLEQPNFKFHTYKIKVGDVKLPAYKFRAK